MNWFKNLFKRKSSAKKRTLTPMEIATERGEPWVEIVSLDLNPNNLGQGSVQFQWNDKFIADLVRHGYMLRPDDTDADLVDRWFTEVCRNVVLETWEQEQANVTPYRTVKNRDIGDGRTEVS